LSMVQLCNYSKHRKKRVRITRRETRATCPGKQAVPVHPPPGCFMLLESAGRENGKVLVPHNDYDDDDDDEATRRNQEKVGARLVEKQHVEKEMKNHPVWCAQNRPSPKKLDFQLARLSTSRDMPCRSATTRRKSTRPHIGAHELRSVRHECHAVSDLAAVGP
jgi:hypothetical protein